MRYWALLKVKRSVFEGSELQVYRALQEGSHDAPCFHGSMHHTSPRNTQTVGTTVLS